MNIFSLSLTTVTFPEKVKTAKVSPISNKGDKAMFSNYRSIYDLPCFSKFLERMSYKRLHTYLGNNNILFNKQFGFRASHSTENPHLELINQLNDS